MKKITKTMTGVTRKQERTPIDIGEGLFVEEIAKKLGVVYKTTNNPNGQLIKKIAETLSLRPSGERISDTYNTASNTKSVGYHPHSKAKYDDEDVEKIKYFIEELIFDEVNEYMGISFRIKKQ